MSKLREAICSLKPIGGPGPADIMADDLGNPDVFPTPLPVILCHHEGRTLITCVALTILLTDSAGWPIARRGLDVHYPDLRSLRSAA